MERILALLAVTFLLGINVLADNIYLFSDCHNKEYTIYGSTADITKPIDMKVTVKYNKSCEQLRQGKQFQTAVEKDYLRPIIDAVQTDPGQYFLNITWDAKTKDGMYPRKFLLDLTTKAYSGTGYESSNTCIILRLRNNRKAQFKRTPERRQFYLSCIRLMDDTQATYLNFRILSLPGSKSPDNKKCRVKRSVEVPKRNCPGAECAKSVHDYPLNIDSHKLELCRCYNKKLSLNITQHGDKFVLNFYNIPPFTSLLSFRVDADNAKKDEPWIDVMGDEIHDGTFEYTTTKTYVANNYTITVWAKCPLDEDEDYVARVTSLCNADQYRAFTTEVIHGSKQLPDPFDMNLVIMVSVLAATVIVTIVTTVVFVRRRKKQVTRDSTTHGNNQDVLAPLNSPIHERGIHERDSPARICTIEDSGFDEICQNVSLLRSGEPKNTGMVTFGRSRHGHRSVLVLSHPETEAHKQVLSCLIKRLQRHEYTVLGQMNDCVKNWVDLGEGAGSLYRDFIVVMSQGLFDLCQEYKKNSVNSNHGREHERWDELLLQRNGEYLPCVTLDALRSRYVQRGRPFRVHFVTILYDDISSERNSSLVDNFIVLNSLFLNKSNTHKYVISLEDIQEDIFDTNCTAGGTGLRQLLHRLSVSEVIEMELDETSL